MSDEETRFYLTQKQAESVHFVVDGEVLCPPDCKGHETDPFEAFAIEAASKIYQASRVELESTTDDRCHCGNASLPQHICPYNDEINGDPEMCACCDDCWQKCADDI